MPLAAHVPQSLRAPSGRPAGWHTLPTSAALGVTVHVVFGSTHVAVMHAAGCTPAHTLVPAQEPEPLH